MTMNFRHNFAPVACQVLFTFVPPDTSSQLIFSSDFHMFKQSVAIKRLRSYVTFMATFKADDIWFPRIRGGYVAYLRSSDRPHTRLNIDAQRQAISALLSKGRCHRIDEIIEREPLVAGDRPALKRAAGLCKSHGATLVFGKLDRMRGGVSWLEHLFDQRIKFRGADIPHLYPSTFYKLKRDDHDWRRLMSEAVSEALADAKSRGSVLGGVRANSEGLKLGPAASLEARKRRAGFRDRSTMNEIELLRRRGITSLKSIATRLNQMGHTAPRGGSWSPPQVRRVIKEFDD